MDCLSAWRGQPVLVTGGTGFVGRYVLNIGAAAGAKITNVSLQATAPPGVNQVQSDIGNIETLQRLIFKLKPVAILHLAASGVAYGEDALSTALLDNVLKLEQLLELASTLKPVPQIVLAGSGAEYGPSSRPHAEDEPLEPSTSYGVSKAAASLVAGYYATRLPVTMLRLFSLYGSGERSTRLAPYIIERTICGKPVELTHCEQLRDYSCVADVAEGFWRALLVPHRTGALRVVNIASDRAITLRVFVEALAAQLRQRGFRPNLCFGALSYRKDEPMVYLADVARMKHLFRWSPTTSLQQGLARMVNDSLAEVDYQDR